MPVEIPKDLVELLTSGVSILVATRDTQRLPEAVRAFAPVIAPDRRHLANLKDNGRIAVAFSRAIDDLSVQVKGTSTDLRPTTDVDRTIVDRYHAAYIEGLYLIGMPRSLTSRFRCFPGTVVTVEVEGVFNQTPGPGAGKPFEAR